MLLDQPNTIAQDRKTKPLQSVEGWIIVITNIEKEMLEDDIFDCFSDFGEIKGISLNTDHRTGETKGYSFIEYSKYEQAQQAIKKMNGAPLGQRSLKVDWAFKTGPNQSKR